MKLRSLAAGSAILFGAVGCTDASKGDDEVLACEVAIIGGGAGGLHTAFRLSPDLGDGVCLFEKEAALGGRIHDVSQGGDAAAPKVGTGARRVMEGQQVLFDLAEELGLTLEAPTLQADLIAARGGFAFSKEDLLPLYPTITPDASGDTETAMYDQLRFGPERANAGTYDDFPAYVRAVVGDEGYAFLRDMTRFRADFTYPLDANSYLDWLDEEWDVCCTGSYPVGGMSAFIRGMQAAVEADGGQIFTSEPVQRIDRGEDGYTLVTSGRTLTATKVVIAVPPQALAYIDGDVADDIRAQAIYDDIVGVKVVTITQWWPESWWTQVVNPDGGEDNRIWRAWTTEHCLNHIEIPLEPYLADAHVTRSVYNDDATCTEYWEDLLATGGMDAVIADVQLGLEHLFDGNGVTEPAELTLPTPLETHVQFWPDAWHWLGAGTAASNADLVSWAVEPLPGEQVALVGEAYNVQRSGWSDAAYKSSIHLLNERYGMSLPGL